MTPFIWKLPLNGAAETKSGIKSRAAALLCSTLITSNNARYVSAAVALCRARRAASPQKSHSRCTFCGEIKCVLGLAKPEPSSRRQCWELAKKTKVILSCLGSQLIYLSAPVSGRACIIYVYRYTPRAQTHTCAADLTNFTPMYLCVCECVK